MIVTIVGKKWKIKLLSPENFLKLHTETHANSEALTEPDTHTVYFRTDYVTEKVVRHELFHCYFDSTSTDSADLNKDQTEEVSASLIGTYGAELIKKADKLFNTLQKKLPKE